MDDDAGDAARPCKRLYQAALYSIIPHNRKYRHSPPLYRDAGCACLFIFKRKGEIR